ncbi:MAG TPA: glycosyltransferase [Ktedonobacterales bacterium]
MTMGVLREGAVVRGGFALVRGLRFAMGKRSRRSVGRHLLLWGYAASVAAFYAVAYQRTLRTGPAGSPEGDVAHSEEPGERARDESETHWPRVSMIVPARNEERNIRACVTSLLEQDYPNYQVIVVDDASTDATPRILDEIRQTHPHGTRLRVVRVERLPEGWAGKPHALHTGAAVADGEWLLFTDADTQHDPNALRTAVRLAQERALDLLSFGTTQDLPDFWGRVLIPMAYMGISLQYPVKAVNDPNSPVAIANGQFILLRTAMYRRIGGYASPRLRATVLDDRDLAQEVKRAHGRLELLDGRALVHTRMYHGLREQWDGWSKNAYAGSRGGVLFFLLMIAGLPAVCIAPFVLLLAGLLGRKAPVALAGAVGVGAILAYRTPLDQQLGVPWRYALTHPLAAAIFTGILARSLWRKVSGRGVEWRGRTYQV